jgi:hypothetical protein
LAVREDGCPPITIPRVPSVSFLDISPGLRARERRTEVGGGFLLRTEDSTVTNPIRQPASADLLGSQSLKGWHGRTLCGGLF